MPISNPHSVLRRTVRDLLKSTLDIDCSMTQIIPVPSKATSTVKFHVRTLDGRDLFSACSMGDFVHKVRRGAVVLVQGNEILCKHEDRGK